MIPEAQAIYSRLANDPKVTGAIAQYNGAPAIFHDFAPEDAVLPYVVFGEVGVTPFDTHDRIGFDSLWDIRCYAPRTGSMQAVIALAMAVRNNLHRGELTINERNTALVWANGGPSPLPAEEHAVGRVVSIRLQSMVLEGV